MEQAVKNNNSQFAAFSLLLGVYALLSVLSGNLNAGVSGSLQLTVQTRDCAGSTGFATFNVGDLVKIQDSKCNNPENPGEQLKKVIIRSRSHLTRFEVVWVTAAEARNIQQQVKDYMTAGTRPIAPQTTVIINEQVTIEGFQRPSRQIDSSPQGEPAPIRPEKIGPKIEIIDPPLSNSRGTLHVFASEGTGSRAIVGRVVSPAGLLSLSVNGQQQEIDPEGFFVSSIPLTEAEVMVRVVAVDTQGKRESVDFKLMPETTTDAPIETPTIPKEASEPATQRISFGNYFALLIGNNDYQKFRDLETAVNDAQTVSALLRDRYGFDVATLINATRYELLTALNQLRSKLTDKDNFLLYYAGHGAYDKVNLRGHWLPVDAEPDNTANWISTMAITDILNQVSAKHILVVADSCYSGAFTRAVATELDPGMSEQARQRWLRVMAKTRSRTVLTSGGLEPVLDIGGGKHSVFARSLIDVLKGNKGILEGTKLFREIKQRVSAATHNSDLEQIPEYGPLKSSHHEFSDFLLIHRSRE